MSDKSFYCGGVGVCFVLKPGSTTADWDNSTGDELIAAIGTTDQDGYYLTAPGIARGQTYTVLFGAKGYERRSFDNALVLAKDDPALYEVDDLPLQSK